MRWTHLSCERKLWISEALCQTLVRQQQLNSAPLGAEWQDGIQRAGMYNRQRHGRSAVKNHTRCSSRQGVTVKQHDVAKLDTGGWLVADRTIERDAPGTQKSLYLSTRAEARCCEVAVDPDCSGHDGLGRLFGGLVNRRMTAGGDERWPSTAFDRVAGDNAAGDICSRREFEHHVGQRVLDD